MSEKMTIKKAKENSKKAVASPGEIRDHLLALGFIEGWNSRQEEIDDLKQSIDILFAQGLKEQLR